VFTDLRYKALRSFRMANGTDVCGKFGSSPRKISAGQTSAFSLSTSNSDNGRIGGMFLDKPASRGSKHPSPQSFAVYDNGVSRTRLPPRGEARETSHHQGYGGRVGRRERGSIRQNMCFSETNPPFLRTISCVSPAFSVTYVVCRARLQVGSFWKTNPPERIFGGVGGRKIGKRSHFWVLPRGFGRAAARPFRGETRNVASADGWASRPYRGEMRGWEPACYLGGVGLGFWR